LVSDTKRHELRSVTGGEQAVDALWNPSTVALIGASSKPRTLAWWPLRLIQTGGFTGRIVPVNPNRAEIEGLPTAASIRDIGGGVDAAVITLDNAGTVQAVKDCAAAGVRAVVLPAQGFGESGERGRELEREMLAAAQAAGMRIHGPNSDGIANFANGAVLSIQPVLEHRLPAGKVAVITQSGATAGSIISRLSEEGIGTRYYASAGNEIDLGFADYLSYALQDPNVEMVATFIEAIRRPEEFVKVAELAAELGKPIVTIKVGRTKQAAARAAAHTGALAGEDRIYDALFNSLGIIRVEELSELVAVAKLYLGQGAPASTDVGIMSVSGGQAGALADRAARFGLALPQLSQASQDALQELFPHGNGLNPSDLTGDIAKKPELAAQAYEIINDDGAVGSLVYARKSLTGSIGSDSARALADAAARGGLPLVVYSMDGEIGEAEAEIYREANVPVFTSASELFTAIHALSRFANRPSRAVREVAPQRLDAAAGVLDDVTARELLRGYGVEFPAEEVVATQADAMSVAERIGFPVALKVSSERIPHKTEIGGVMLGLASSQGVGDAFDVLMQRGTDALGGDAPDGVLVQQQVVDGVETIVGLVVDEAFGPFVLVGTGGVTAELLDDAVLERAPVSLERAREMITGLRGKPLLDGFRGAPATDVDALARVVSAISEFGHDHSERLSELDLNPVLVRPDGAGAVAVDALIVLR
jgi:acetate---CoA ligase (ADP-forming)